MGKHSTPETPEEPDDYDPNLSTSSYDGSHYHPGPSDTHCHGHCHHCCCHHNHHNYGWPPHYPYWQWYSGSGYTTSNLPEGTTITFTNSTTNDSTWGQSETK